MIPQAYIYEWNQQVPWQTMEQVEQNLVISRALFEIFSDDLLANSLAFRGGTALHKLFFNPQLRYSEDIDLVQITAKPFGPIANRIRERLSFLGGPKRSPKAHNFTLYFRFESEFLGDTTGLLRKGESYDPSTAYELVSMELIKNI